MLRRAWPIAIVIGIYALWSVLLIAQKPGLQYDEAMLIAGAVHLEHSPAVFDLERTPNAWVCPFEHCIPLMDASYYVGALKEYVALPLFALFGPRTPVVRLVALLLTALGIWGIYILTAEWFGRPTGIIAAFIMAMNPAFVSMTIFDNGALSAMIATVGLTCASIALYQRTRTFWAAFALGAAIGLGVWARANFVWIVIAGAAAALIVFRRRILIPVTHWAGILAGGVTGGAPFLIFQILSGGGTWRVREALAVSAPLTTLLRQRIFLLADTLLSDGEHRLMWAGPPLPFWQLELFPCMVAAAWLVCLFGSFGTQKQRGLPQLLALASLIMAGELFFSRLVVAEHHLIVLLPFAAVLAAVAGSILQRKYPWALAATASLLLIYTCSAAYWQVAAVRGLRRSGGVGVWSDAGLPLARYLDQNFRGREIKFVDWGLEYNMYVLTNGRLKSREIYAPTSEDRSFDDRPWADEIRDGGVFVLNGPENRQYLKPSAGFLHALTVTHPAMQSTSFYQRSGQTYAELFEIQPGSVQDVKDAVKDAAEEPPDRIPMDNVRLDRQLTGFYPPEGSGFRWTRREFSARLGFALKDPNGAQLVMQVYVPQGLIEKVGPVTLTARLNGRALSPETWAQPGKYVFRRDVDAAAIASGEVRVDFALDKSLLPAARNGAS